MATALKERSNNKFDNYGSAILWLGEPKNAGVAKATASIFGEAWSQKRQPESRSYCLNVP